MRVYPPGRGEVRDESRWYEGNAAIVTALAALVTLIAALMILINPISAYTDDNQVISGKSYSYQVPLQLEGLNYTYQWGASDGYFASCDQRIFNWTAPDVDAPKEVTITVVVTCNESGCVAANEIRLVVNPKSAEKPGIRISKGCVYEAPVYVGDAVTYTYNVTNTGDLPLRDVNITDVHNWGPDCHPVYIRGDDGSQMLEPGESRWYECRYSVPDPSDYPRLHIMAAKSGLAMAAVIKKLMNMKDRLAIKMDNLRSMREQFDTDAAFLVVDHRLLGGVNYTFYNYTNTVTGDSLKRIVKPDGRLNKTIYEDSIDGAILTTTYDPSGKITTDDLYYPPPGNMECLKIEYDVPSQGYRTLTITDYGSGDTLILVIDEHGKILNTEYRKTPGYRPFEERFFLKNTATVTAKTPDGWDVSDSDSFTLEIFKPLPILRVVKTAEPDPAMPEGILNYTILYENTGSEDAHGVVITEAYDKILEILWSDPKPDFGTDYRWTVGDLRRGESGSIKIMTKVGSSAVPGQLIENKVDLTCNENTTAQSVINTTVAGSGLNITKTASASIIGAGGDLTYTISYMNNGSEKQTDVVIHDYLDEHVIFKMARPGPAENISGYYRWVIGELDPGEGGKIEISVKVKDKKFFSKNATSIFNTYKINSSQFEGTNSTLETLVVHSLWIDKAADKKAYNRDENITYTIRFGNEDSSGLKATDISIVDVLPKVDLLTVSPAPNSTSGNILRWNFKELKAGENGSIVLVVHIPKKANMSFEETSSVKGEGYVYVSRRLSTAEEDSALINRVNISGYYGPVQSNASASSTVAILGSSGTKIRATEHGSGYYEEEEESRLRLENKSISLEKSIFAKHRKTTFSLPGNRNISYESLWSDLTSAENHILNDVVSENYLYTDTLSKNSSFAVDMNQTVYRSEAEFNNGMAHISYKKYEPDSAKTTIDIGEDYHGSFKVLESVDSYGESVEYAKSSRGKGFVSSDKRPDKLQRSFEHGSGYYYSEETSQIGYVVKDVKMLYAQVNQTAGLQNLSYADPWTEGMRTEDEGKGLLISEEIQSAPYIQKEAEMGRSHLSLFGELNGTMDIEAALGRSPKREDHRIDQRLAGSFKVDTALSVYEAPKHLSPQVTVTKKAVIVDEDTVLFLINVTNDGNKLLGPVNVSDHLPEGLTFINASIRPEISEQIINWTIPSLEISRTITIKLNAKIKEGSYPQINTVDVEARYLDQVLTAHNCSRIDRYDLPCCLGAEGNINLTKVFNVSAVRGDWGDWTPAPCCQLTSEAADCFKESEDYYDSMDSLIDTDNCTSTYECP